MTETVKIREVQRKGTRSVVEIRCCVDGIDCRPYLHTIDPAVAAKTAGVMDDLPTLVDRFRAVVSMLEEGKGDRRTDTEKAVDARLFRRCRTEDMDEATLVEAVKTGQSKAMDHHIARAKRIARAEAAATADMRDNVYKRCGVECLPSNEDVEGSHDEDA